LRAHKRRAQIHRCCLNALPSHLEESHATTYLETSLRRVRLLRLSCRVAASLTAGLSTSLSCKESVSRDVFARASGASA
jgi:hypothetical protein